ncbi:MAG: insulinase family protein, partial [Deltaproteobacteria bacterium]
MNDPVHKSVLANGLRVVTVELPHLHTGMIAAYVRAGSRHEEPSRNGVSHFLE